MQPHLLAVETRLSSSTSPCSESLSTRLGHTCALLKDKQVEVVSNFLEGYDVFGVLRTGYAKSLCFACHHLSVGLSPRKIFSTTWTLQIQNSLPLPVIVSPASDSSASANGGLDTVFLWLSTVGVWNEVVSKTQHFGKYLDGRGSDIL